MRRLLLLLLLPAVAGCAFFREPPEQGISTGATVVYNGGGFKVFSVCDRGNLVYTSEKNPQVHVVPGGCNVGGPGGVGGPSLIPQPFIVHLVPAPPTVAPLSAAPAEAEPRAPIVIQVQPIPAPAPEATCPPAAKAAPKAAPRKPCP